MLCATDCITNGAVPRWGNGCGNIQKRDGGIPNLIFMACNMRFATVAEGSIQVKTPTGSMVNIGVITDFTSWATAVTHNLIRISPEGIGEKPESTFTNARFSSCRPEEIASETHLLNFTSYDIDPDNFYDRSYWNTIRLNYGKYRVMYLSCGNILNYSGDVEDPGFEFSPTVLGYVKPPNKEDKDFYRVNLSFIYAGIPDMIEVVNLSEALNIDANS